MCQWHCTTGFGRFRHWPLLAECCRIASKEAGGRSQTKSGHLASHAEGMHYGRRSQFCRHKHQYNAVDDLHGRGTGLPIFVEKPKMDSLAIEDIGHIIGHNLPISPKKTKSPVRRLGYLLYSIGRGGGIRTRDPLHPMQVRYQAALRPDTSRALYPQSRIFQRRSSEITVCSSARKSIDAGIVVSADADCSSPPLSPRRLRAPLIVNPSL